MWKSKLKPIEWLIVALVVAIAVLLVNATFETYYLGYLDKDTGIHDQQGQQQTRS